MTRNVIIKSTTTIEKAQTVADIGENNLSKTETNVVAAGLDFILPSDFSCFGITAIVFLTIGTGKDTTFAFGFTGTALFTIVGRIAFFVSLIFFGGVNVNFFAGFGGIFVRKGGLSGKGITILISFILSIFVMGKKTMD
jgi:hypothetical protein